MKRALMAIAIVVVVAVLLVGGLIAATFMGRRAVVDGFEVAGGRVVVDGFSGVAVLPVGDGRVVLVDAGNDVEGTVILAELARLGLTREAVTAILLTHGHPDHIGAVRQFPAATVMAMEPEVDLIEGREGARAPLTRWFPVSPTGITVGRRLRDGETIMLGDAEVRAYAIPGHTAGSAAYLVRGALFVGDSADVASDGRVEGSAWIFSDSQEQNRQSLAALARRLRESGLRVETLVPAHSGALEDGLTALERFAASVP